VGDNIDLTLAQGWTIGSSGNPISLKHSNPGAGFLIQVVQTTATSASAFGQQFLSQTLSQAISNLQVNNQGSSNLTWKTFTEVNIYTVNGAVTTAQGSQPIFGQVFALLNPQTHLGAEIYSASGSSADYTSVNQTVLAMVNSLAD
jgi:hypothetical protein